MGYRIDEGLHVLDFGGRQDAVPQVEYVTGPIFHGIENAGRSIGDDFRCRIQNHRIEIA